MTWQEDVSRRTLTSKTWTESDKPGRFVREQVLKTALHYHSMPDADDWANEVDLTPVRVNNDQLDGWAVTANGYHYALGQPAGKADGWVGFGGRQGQHWLLYRLLRVGYLHWPTRAWQDVGGPPTYDRARLDYETRALTIGPPSAQRALNALTSVAWQGIWETPGGGRLDITWRVEGRHLKEEIKIDQTARQWIAANSPPTTPPAGTWFGFVFRLDVSDVPRWVKAQVVQDISGDFDDADGVPIALQDTAGRLLAFLPIGAARSEPYLDGEGNPMQDVVPLRTRIWRDPDGSHYLLVGARVPDLAALHEGGIIFDPTLELQPDSEGLDTYVASGAVNNNYGAAVALRTTDTQKTLIEFDLSGITADATCNSATLSMWSINSFTEVTFNIHEIAAANGDWVEGTKTGALEAGSSCWNYKIAPTDNWAGSVGLSTEGTDYGADVIGTITYPDEAADTEAQSSLDITAVEGWFGETNTNYGILLIGSGGSDRSWHSSDGETAGYRPKLVVDYTTAAGAAGYMTLMTRYWGT
jgi:hypothetical protein